MNLKFQRFKLDLEKAEKPEIKLSTSIGSLKKQENTRKNIYFCFIAYMKAFDCVDHDKLENSSRDGNIRPPDLPPEKSVYRSKSNRIGKGLCQGCILSPYLFNLYAEYIMRMLGWVKHKLE